MKRGGKEPKNGQEQGLCVLCGGDKPGWPAKKDAPISAARKAREILGMPPKHSVACARCLAPCLEKRSAFEKKMKSYWIGAALFVLIVLAGGLIYQQLDMWLAVPALLGAAIILLLPYGSYFPAFDVPDGE